MLHLTTTSPARPAERTWLVCRWRVLRAQADRGSSTLELALLSPLLISLVLLVVLCGRLVSAQLDIDAAAHAAARAASLDRTVTQATLDARHDAIATLADRHTTCRQPSITIAADDLQPGGTVTVTLSCSVPLADLALLAVPGTRRVTATGTSPIDVWRGQP
jgi:Flp pilus assembly protein TadG